MAICSWEPAWHKGRDLLIRRKTDAEGAGYCSWQNLYYYFCLVIVLCEISLVMFLILLLQIIFEAFGWKVLWNLRWFALNQTKDCVIGSLGLTEGSPPLSALHQYHIPLFESVGFTASNWEKHCGENYCPCPKFWTVLVTTKYLRILAAGSHQFPNAGFLMRSIYGVLLPGWIR